MKKVSILLLAVVSAISLCFGLAACGGDKEEKKPLATPANVKVEADTLSWGAVEGASAGYTVKINADETTKVTAASLDLTTVTAKLAEGANTLSVKANATDKSLESAYSVTVTYTYTPAGGTEKPDEPGPDEKQPLAAPTGLKVEGGTLTWTAVEGATAGYTVKINADEMTKVTAGTSLDLTTVTAKLVSGENTLSVKANATDKALESAYSATVKYTYTPDAPHEHQLTAHPAKDATCTEAGNEAYWTCSGCLKTFKDANGDEEFEANAWVKNALGHSMENKVEAKQATCDTDGNEEYFYCTRCEKYFKDANGSEEYPNGMPTIAKLGHKSATKTDAKEATVGEAGNPAYWYCEDCGTYFADNEGVRGEKLEPNAAPTIPAIEIEKTEIYTTYIGGAGSKEFYIFGKFTDTEGKVWQLEKDKLLLTLTVDGTDMTEDAVVSYGSDDACVIKLTLTSQPALETATAITYKLFGQTAETTVNLKANSANFWFGDDGVKENRAYSENGEVKGNNAGNTEGFTAYFDVYEDGDVKFEDFGNKAVTLAGMPLVAKVPKNEVSTLDEFEAYLAGKGIRGEHSVVIVGYQAKEEGSEIIYTSINSASVSDVLELNLTEDALKTRLVQPTTGVVVHSDGSVLVTMPDGYLTSLTELFKLQEAITRETLNTYVRLHIAVTYNGETGDFYSDISNGGDITVTSQAMIEGIYGLFEQKGPAKYQIAISLALVENSEYAATLRDSMPRVCDLEFTEESFKLGFYGTWALKDGDNERIKYSWEELDNPNVGSVVIKIYDTNGKEEGYDYTKDTPFVVYTINSRTFVNWETAAEQNPALNDFIKAAWIQYLKDNKVEKDNITYTYTFAFAMQRLASEKAKEMGFIDSPLSFAMKDEKLDTKTFTWEEKDIVAPSDAQFGYAQKDALTFLRRANADGSVFTADKAQYVEIQFKTAGGKTGTAYIYAVEETNDEGENVLNAYLCKTQDAKEEGRLSLAAVGDSWKDRASLENWVNTAFNWTEDDKFDVTTGSVKTRIVISEESPYLFDGEWSKEVTYQNDCTQKEDWEKVPAPAPEEGTDNA